MNKIQNNEKSLKRYLKNKISFNLQTVVKIMITGIFVFSLTACGGGSSNGGSGSVTPPPSDSITPPSGGSDSVTPPPSGSITPPSEENNVLQKNPDNISSMNSNTNNTTLVSLEGISKNMDSDIVLESSGSNSVGIQVNSGTSSSTVEFENEGTIKISGDNSVGILAIGDVKVTNSNKIEISGDETVAISVEKGAVGINKGTITGKSGVKNESYSNESETLSPEGIEASTTTVEKTLDKIIGLKAEDNSKIINDGKIHLEGYAIGMITEDNSKGINNGEIEIISGIENYEMTTVNKDTGDYVTYEKGQRAAYSYGMIANDNSTIENSSTGKITLKGNGSAMKSNDSSTAINNGSIKLEARKNTISYSDDYNDEIWENLSDKEVYDRVIGMLADDSSIATNNGNIYAEYSGIGMQARDGATVINGENGVITITADSSGMYYNYAERRGMKATQGIAENRGTITVTDGTGIYVWTDGTKKSEGINKGEINITDGTGMDATSNGSGSFISSIINESTGAININVTVTGIGYVTGMQARNGSTATNKGTITIDMNGSGGSGIGMQARNGSTATNKGTITIDMNGLGGSGTGMSGNSSYGSGTSSSITNEGSIKLNLNTTGAGSVDGTGMSVMSGTAINKGAITIDMNGLGGSGTGMSLYDGTATNKGAISITGSGTGSVSATGMSSYGSGTTSTITNEGTINLNLSTTGAGIGSYVIGTGMSVVSDVGTATNKGTITVDVNISSTITAYGMQAFSSSGTDSTSIINESTGAININVTGTGYATGMQARNGSTATNKGAISITESGTGNVNGTGMSGSSTNESTGNINLNLSTTGDGSGMASVNGTGMSVSNGTAINEGTITVTVNGTGSGSATGMSGSSSSGSGTTSTITNEGTINLNLDTSGMASVSGTGMSVSGGTAINKGTIDITGSGTGSVSATGMSSYGSGTTSTITNEGTINLNLDTTGARYVNGAGMSVSGGTAINKGTIDITGSGTGSGTGMSSYGSGTTSTITNEGTINLNLDTTGARYVNGAGMSVSGGTAINKGTINVTNGHGISSSGAGSTITNEATGKITVSGAGSYGMYATSGAQAINEGIINVTATAAGGMYANGTGATIINNGTINIDKDHTGLGTIENGIDTIAMKAENGATLTNNGTINSSSDVVIATINNGLYIVGTSANGIYGKVTANNIDLSGNLAISADIASGSFENSYSLNNIFVADKISLDDYQVASTSLLYDADLFINANGNIDGRLTRSSRTLASFVDNNLKETADMFNEYMISSKYVTLTSDGKNVVDNIFDATSSVSALSKAIADTVPTVYSNLNRQVLHINEVFETQYLLGISNLEDSNFNILLLENFVNVDKENYVEGYESFLTGFVGTMKFENELYTSLGFGHSNIDFDNDSSSKINTIHIGAHKFYDFNDYNVKLSLTGEYNFHDVSRNINTQDRTADSDFNSYVIGISSEISKDLDSFIPLKPYIGFDIATINIDRISETNASSLNAELDSENFTSIVPKVGLETNYLINNFNLFAKVEYGYELGDIDKNQSVKLQGFDRTALNINPQEGGTAKVEIGAKYKLNNFDFSGTVGKSFGKKTDDYATISIGYTF